MTKAQFMRVEGVERYCFESSFSMAFSLSIIRFIFFSISFFGTPVSWTEERASTASIQLFNRSSPSSSHRTRGSTGGLFPRPAGSTVHARCTNGAVLHSAKVNCSPRRNGPFLPPILRRKASTSLRPDLNCSSASSCCFSFWARTIGKYAKREEHSSMKRRTTARSSGLQGCKPLFAKASDSDPPASLACSSATYSETTKLSQITASSPTTSIGTFARAPGRGFALAYSSTKSCGLSCRSTVISSKERLVSSRAMRLRCAYGQERPRLL
mmetsp:Transcript_27846/g.47337  ORF Transcript_27846/g.47337 Transcript_27846/m.47337 type:complete len:269 (-) Transcript_27846:20-826(-)